MHYIFVRRVHWKAESTCAGILDFAIGSGKFHEKICRISCILKDVKDDKDKEITHYLVPGLRGACFVQESNPAYQPDWYLTQVRPGSDSYNLNPKLRDGKVSDDIFLICNKNTSNVLCDKADPADAGTHQWQIQQIGLQHTYTLRVLSGLESGASYLSYREWPSPYVPDLHLGPAVFVPGDTSVGTEHFQIAIQKQ
jgi:hypothetical protein